MKNASSPPSGVTRRQFLNHGTAITAAVATGIAARAAVAQTDVAPRRADALSRTVTVGMIGVSRTGRGSHLAATIAGIEGVRVAYVCDVDQRNLDSTVGLVSKRIREGTPPPKGVRDLRQVLDDKAVDAVVIATPDHWHSPAAILACSAGKHVYVEKPCCHNAHEGELLVEAATKHKRLVQHGTQRRTWPGIREAIERLRAGDIGRLISARSYYWSTRPSIGRGAPAPVPSWLDWSLWQGPAPEQEFHDNYVPYNWHWFWQWGTGELGNNGVHYLDLCRWGLGVDCPKTVSYTGGKYRFPDDDQQTPDTSLSSYEYGDKMITWESRSWAGQTPIDPQPEVLFAGEKGFLAIRDKGYTIHDLKGKEIAKGSGPGGDVSHLQNFVDAVRGEATLNAPISEGYKSALLCNLGNISYRIGRTLHLDPEKAKITGDSEAAALWRREYRKGWEPKV